MISDWTTRTLGELTEFKSGKTPSKSNPEFWDGHIPWISASSMHGNRYSYSKLRITDAAIKAGSIILDGNTILLLVRGSTLHNRIPVGITTAKVTFNQDVKAIIPKDESVSPWFLLYWLMSKENELLGMVENTGIGAGKLDTKVLKNLEIRIPTKHDQSKLIAFFKSIDDKIHLNHLINQTLESIAQTIFKSWFVDFDPVKAKMEGREPEGMEAETTALFPDKLVESELGMIPEGWEVRRVNEVFKRLKAPRRYKKDAVLPSGNVPIFEQGSNILLGYHNEVADFNASMDEPIFIFGDHTCVMRLSLQPFSVSQNVIPLCGNGVDTTWCYHATYGIQTFQEYRRHWMELINKQVIVPPFDIQRQFRDSIVNMLLMIESLEQENLTLSSIRDTLLPKLISGEIQIQ